MKHGVFSPGLPGDDKALDAYIAKVGKTPEIVNFYRDFGDRFLWRNEVENLHQFKITPMVTWEPLGVSVEEIADGKQDGVIKAAGEDIAKFGSPVLVRFAHEMNGAWYPWSEDPRIYKEAWRRVARGLRAVAPNTRMVWCPNVMGGATVRDFEDYWPGRSYVDWLALDGYNWGGKEWQSFREVFGPSLRRISKLKPLASILIAETSSAEPGRNKAAWIKAMSSDLPVYFPRVRAVCWFDKDMTKEGQRDWRIASSQYSLNAYRAVIK